jgi:hypothetical protein
MKKIFPLLGMVLLLSAARSQTTSAAATPPSSGPTAPTSSAAPAPAKEKDDISKFVSAQFGSGFTASPIFGQTSLILLTGDFDGDGVEDSVVVATTKEPFTRSVELNYKVIDPYDAYFGWGNARDTVRFAEHDDHARVLLVTLSWRAATPKGKFVIINVPFDHLAVENVSLKRKQRTVISASEEDSMRSYLFWDGKKWKFAPGPMD